MNKNLKQRWGRRGRPRKEGRKTKQLTGLWRMSTLSPGREGLCGEQGWCDAQNNEPPKVVHNLIPKTCEHITLQVKKDSTDVIKLRILKTETILDYSGGPDAATRALIGKRGRQEGQRRRYKDGRGHEPRNAGSL